MPKGRVLVVDDQRYFRELIEGLLSDEGYEVQTAASGEEALHVLDRQPFDVVITDLVMPVMSGGDLVQRVKERDGDQDVIVITGVVDVKSAVEAMKIGADDYLLKPFDREALTSSLETIMNHRRLRHERDRLLQENIEYLGERSLFERALSLFGSLNAEVLAQHLLDGLGVETGAQGGVFWLDTEGGGERFTLFGARGLVRPEEECRVLELGDLPAAIRDGGAACVCVDWEEDGIARPALLMALRRGGRVHGLARLTDKLGGDEFDDVDRGCAEKFAPFAERAFENAERFHKLERRSLQDPATGAYRIEYLRDVTRNEIEKANRFGRGFSLARVSVGPIRTLREGMGEQAFSAWWNGFARAVRRLLRATDLLAVDDSPDLWILLAESDAIGAATFKRRSRLALEACEALVGLPPETASALRIAVASYPRDATQLESLVRILNERIHQDPRCSARERRFERLTRAECFGELLRQAEPEAADACASLVRFALSEVGRRARERNFFFFHPGIAFADTLADFDTRSVGASATQLVILADPPAPRVGEGGVSWLPAGRLPGCPPFLVHYGDGPAYVLVCDEKEGDAGRPLFHTADAALAEYLAFRLQRELRLPVTA